MGFPRQEYWSIFSWKEKIAIFSCRGSSPPRDQNPCLLCLLALVCGFFTTMPPVKPPVDCTDRKWGLCRDGFSRSADLFSQLSKWFEPHDCLESLLPWSFPGVKVLGLFVKRQRAEWSTRFFSPTLTSFGILPYLAWTSLQRQRKIRCRHRARQTYHFQINLHSSLSEVQSL